MWPLPGPKMCWRSHAPQARRLSMRSVKCSSVDRDLDRADQARRSEVALHLGVGHPMIDEIATKPVGLRWLDWWSTLLGPDQPDTSAAISFDDFPAHADMAFRPAQSTVLDGVSCEFVEKQTERRGHIARELH